MKLINELKDKVKAVAAKEEEKDAIVMVSEELMDDELNDVVGGSMDKAVFESMRQKIIRSRLDSNVRKKALDKLMAMNNLHCYMTAEQVAQYFFDVYGVQ